MKVQVRNIYILRRNSSPSETLGVIRIPLGNSTIKLDSLELPWKNNTQDISCIPEGTYPYHKWYSPTFERIVLRLENVPDREDILIHPANYVRQLEGCIAPGVSTGDIDGDGLLDVEKSVKALEQILDNVADTGYVHILNNF